MTNNKDIQFNLENKYMTKRIKNYNQDQTSKKRRYLNKLSRISKTSSNKFIKIKGL
jgi:hypothetical protein